MHCKRATKSPLELEEIKLSVLIPYRELIPKVSPYRSQVIFSPECSWYFGNYDMYQPRAWPKLVLMLRNRCIMKEISSGLTVQF